METDVIDIVPRKYAFSVLFAPLLIYDRNHIKAKPMTVSCPEVPVAPVKSPVSGADVPASDFRCEMPVDPSRLAP
jgi:hypothetical protein